MVKLLFLVFLCQQFVLPSGFEKMGEFLEGEHGYYEINPEATSFLMQLIAEAPPSPATEKFQIAYQRSKRPEAPLGATYEVVKNAYYRTRGKLPSLQGNAPISNPSSSSEEMITQVISFLQTHGPEKIASFMDHIESVKLSQNIAKRKYDEYLRIFGPIRVGTIRNFINKAILGITRQPPLEGAPHLFALMQASGFLRTSIQSPMDYTYSQRLATREFLQNHEEIHTLVLACGNFIPYTVSYDFCKRSEGGCGCCQEGHHLSKGEMTVTIFDQLQYIDTGESADYNEEGSSSDVIADITHESFWQGVIEGLGGRKLRRIKEHNMYNPELSLPRIDQIKDALEDGGVFETLCPLSSQAELSKTIKTLQEKGFHPITTQISPQRYIQIRAIKQL